MTVSFIIIALVLVLFLVIRRQPDEFRIVRSASINAPANIVFNQVNNFQRWGAWSPWAAMDLQTKYTFDGPVEGVGAICAWEGNSKVGTGRMTITDSIQNELVRMRLEFFKPMQATNIAEFHFTEENNQTLVTWSMSGKNKFLGKAVNLVMNCEKMVGGQFEQGLENLKRLSTQS